MKKTIIISTLMALAGCAFLESVPAPVWQAGLRIGGAIAKEYIGSEIKKDELANIITEALDQAIDETNAVIGGQPRPVDVELFLRQRLGNEGYSEDRINELINIIYPAPDNVEALAVGDPRLHISYIRGVVEGIRQYE